MTDTLDEARGPQGAEKEAGEVCRHHQTEGDAAKTLLIAAQGEQGPQQAAAPQQQHRAQQQG